MSTKATTAEETKAAETKNETVMYIGPTFKGAAYGSLYNNGLTQPLKERIEQSPVFGELVVPVSELAKKRMEMRDKASAFSKCFEKANTILKDEEGKA